MDPFYYEIFHTTSETAAAAALLALIQEDRLLSAVSRSWSRPDALPANADLYVALVVVSDDLADDAALRARISELAARGFPVLPVVPSVKAYDFNKAPIPALSERNAVGRDDPQQIIGALRHHAGLWRHGSGGQVFISYARRDGAALAQCVCEKLTKAGIRAFLDKQEVVGAARIQDDIRAEMERSDLVLLVDSRGAAESPWVGDELDMARVAHVPVIAVTPTAEGLDHHLRAPHVAWRDGDDLEEVAASVVDAAKRLLGRQVTFRDRVARTLRQVAELRGWDVKEDEAKWMIRLESHELRVECSADEPTIEGVMGFRNRLGHHGRGAFVGGTRPYPRITAQGFANLGGERVRIAPLPRVASTISERLAAKPLGDARIFLSAALPDSEDREFAAHTLAPFVVTFVQTLFALGATIVFGGHPDVVPLVHRALVDLADANSGGIELFQATLWRHSADLTPLVRDARVFRKLSWHGDGSGVLTDLAAMRSAMITSSLTGAAFVGGKIHQTVGNRPGIFDEYERFRVACSTRPAFLLGLARGASAELLRRGEPPAEVLPPRLTDELRNTHDPDLATALIVSELLSRGGQVI